MQLSLPNFLTVLRLLAAPGVAVAFVVFARPAADIVAVTLFIAASLTDWLDGKLARAWNVVSRFGAALDPIADKAMVLIALGTLLSVSQLSGAILLPAALIMFREVFVSGLREFLGAVAGALKVSKVAKWKTAVQMVAISILFFEGVFAHYAGMLSFGMDGATVEGILSGEIEDVHGLSALVWAMETCQWVGLAALWLAALLTLVTGADYLHKAWPHLKDPSHG